MTESPSCYNIAGLNQHMPLVLAMEMNGFVARMYDDQGRN